MLISHRPHVRTLTFALTALAALAVLLGLVVAAVLRNGDTVRHHPSFPTPDPPAQDRFHFSDLLAPAADGTPLVAGLSPRSGQTEIGKLAAALSVVADPDDYGTARRLLSDEVDRAVASFAGGSDADAPVLAKLFLLDRWTNRGLVGEKVVQAIADQLDRSGSASAWNAEVAATIWLRSEVAERLLARGDRARADRLAAIDSTLACPLAEHAAEDAASTAVVLAYTARHGDLACLRDALPSLRSALLAQPDGTTAYGLEQLGPLTDGDRKVLAGWLASKSSAGGLLSPQTIEELAPTVVATGERPTGLGAAAARTLRVGARVPDRIDGSYTLDAALFAQLDDARGRSPWTPDISFRRQLSDVGRGDWVTLALAGSGRLGSTEAAAALRRGCGATAVSEPADGAAGGAPFALVVRLALDASTRPCGADDPDGVAATVAASPAIPDQMGHRQRAWATAYVACRYAGSGPEQDALRDRVRSMPWDAPLAWDPARNPEDYYPMFDEYAAQWLDRFVVKGRSCRELTIWDQR